MINLKIKVNCKFQGSNEYWLEIEIFNGLFKFYDGSDYGTFFSVRRNNKNYYKKLGSNAYITKNQIPEKLHDLRKLIENNIIEKIQIN